MSDNTTCPHGLKLNDNSHLDGMAFACPIGQCQCCGQAFPYIDMGIYSDAGSYEVTHNPTLCPRCGGIPETVISGENPLPIKPTGGGEGR